MSGHGLVFPPGRLWSLWEIMKNFDAEGLFQISRTLEFLGYALANYSNAEYREVINKGGKLGLEKMREELSKIEVTLSIKLLDRMLIGLSDPVQFTREDAIAKLGELSERTKDELSSIEFVHIDAGMRELFDPPGPLFGKDVENKFPSVIDEIAEAGKCLALDRSTAGAFHSIRCLEAGIRAMARCLNVPDPTRASDRNWGAVLKRVRDSVDGKWPGSSTRMKGDGEFFDQAYTALAAMQNPWRNATMHLDQKYTPEEARHIFEVVKGYMKKIASRMDEDGLPMA